MIDTPNTKKHKLSNLEIDDRVSFIMTLLARYKTRSQILGDKTVMSWQLRNVSIDKYVKRARELVALNASQARTEHLARSILNLNYLYKESLSAKDTRLCLDIQKELNRVLRLDQVTSSRHDPAQTGTSPADVRKMLDKIKVINAPNSN